MSNRVMDDYFELSEMLDDNIELIAKIIHEHYPKKPTKFKLSRIISDLEECTEERMKKYSATIKKILDYKAGYIKAFYILNS